MDTIKQLFRQLTCLPIYGYRWLIKPVLPSCCRYYPSCSEYALIAIQRLGVIKGLYRTSGRLLRCHPWKQGGYDPVLFKNEKY